MNFLTRTPFAILGAFGLVSLAGGVVQLEQNLAGLVQAWRTVTDPVMEFLFGWLFEWIGWKFPALLKDYLTVGMITMISTFRAFGNEESNEEDEDFNASDVLIGLTIMFLFWPLIVLLAIQSVLAGDGKTKTAGQYAFESREQALTFLETFIYAALIIFGSYSLIFSGVSNPAPP